MKPFLSNKAGASFYGGGNYTVVYHATDIEIVCKLHNRDNRTIGYTHLYLIFVGKGDIIICANWNDFLRHLDSIKDMEHFTSIMKRPCPLFYSLLREEHPEGFEVINLPERDLLVIGKVIRPALNEDYSSLALPFRNDITEVITKLSNNLIHLYTEIQQNCPLALWKQRLNDLWC